MNDQITTVLFKQIFNNSFLRKKIQSFIKPLEYYFYYKGEEFKEESELNVWDILKKKDYDLLLKKLESFLDLFNQEEEEVLKIKDYTSHVNYYQHWLDWDFLFSQYSYKDLIEVLSKANNSSKEKLDKIIKCLYKGFLINKNDHKFNRLYQSIIQTVGLESLSKSMDLNILSESIRIISNEQIIERDIKIHESFKHQTPLIARILFPGVNEHGPVNIELVKQLLKTSSHYNYDLANDKDKELGYDMVYNIKLVSHEIPFFVHPTALELVVYINKDFIQLVVNFITKFINMVRTITLIVEDYDTSVVILDLLKTLVTGKTFKLDIKMLSEDTRIIELFYSQKPSNFVYSTFSVPPKLIANLRDKQEFDLIQRYLPYYIQYDYIVSNPFIKDIFAYVELVIKHYGMNVKVVNMMLQTYHLAIGLGNIAFVKQMNEVYVQKPLVHELLFEPRYYLSYLLLAYYYDRDIYNYLNLKINGTKLKVSDSKFIDFPQDEYEKYQASLFRLAIVKHDIHTLRHLYYSLDTVKQILTIQSHGLEVYTSLAYAKSFQEKRHAIEILEFIKGEYFKNSAINSCQWGIIYFQDKLFASQLLECFDSIVDFKSTFVLSMAMGALVTSDSISHLVNLFDNLTRQEIIVFQQSNIETLILKYLIALKNRNLKGIIYIFERFQNHINESILDILAYQAVATDNHTLLDILLHRTKIRLIQPKSKQHEVIILNKIKTIVKSSQSLFLGSYFKFYPYDLTLQQCDTTAAPPQIMSYEEFENIKERYKVIDYYSLKCDQNDILNQIFGNTNTGHVLFDKKRYFNTNN